MYRRRKIGTVVVAGIRTRVLMFVTLGANQCFFFICLLLPDYIFVFSRINAEFWLWGGSGKSTDRRRYDIAMQYYIFFFLRLLL